MLSLVRLRCLPHVTTNRHGDPVESAGPSTDLRPPPPEERAGPDHSTDWAQLAASSTEFFAVRAALHGVPYTWIQAIEKRAQFAAARKPLHSALQYRLSCLGHGIILLQEAKFILDMFENCLRFAVVRHLVTCAADIDAVAQHTPKRKMRLGTRCEVGPLSAEIINLQLYELTGMIEACWYGLPKARSPRNGFRNLFWPQKYCRDINQFKRDAKSLRDLRNLIAHSRVLPLAGDVHSAAAASRKWLQPLGVDLDARVRSYRLRRPRFLEMVS